MGVVRGFPNSCALQTRQHGLTYLALIFAVAILSLSGAAASELWTTAQQRDKERELLTIGHQFRLAIGRYYEASPGGAKQYPRNLDDLLKDNRHLVAKRHLRKIYLDPLTLKAEWGLVEAPTGGFMGIYSLSDKKPLKAANFEPADKELEGKEKYSAWKFVYVPPAPEDPMATLRNKNKQTDNTLNNEPSTNPQPSSVTSPP